MFNQFKDGPEYRVTTYAKTFYKIRQQFEKVKKEEVLNAYWNELSENELDSIQ